MHCHFYRAVSDVAGRHCRPHLPACTTPCTAVYTTVCSVHYSVHCCIHYSVQRELQRALLHVLQCAACTTVSNSLLRSAVAACSIVQCAAYTTECSVSLGCAAVFGYSRATVKAESEKAAHRPTLDIYPYFIVSTETPDPATLTPPPLPLCLLLLPASY